MTARRILLVDDEEQLVRLMSRYLERFGYDTVAASSTAEAWRTLQSGAAFSAAIIDVTLQNPSGEELARRMLAANPEVQVILNSGYATDVRPLEETFPGRVRFLQKPFSAEMLVEAVRQVAG